MKGLGKKSIYIKCFLRYTEICREYTLARRRGGWGVNILEDERNRIALLQ